MGMWYGDASWPSELLGEGGVWRSRGILLLWDREGKERRETRKCGLEREESKGARLQREVQDTGAVCSQLCLEMNVTAMLTLANTPAPPHTQAPSPATAPRATRL